MADLVHQSLRNEYNYLDRASQLLYDRIQQVHMEVEFLKKTVAQLQVSGAAARQQPVEGQAVPGHSQQGACAPADPSVSQRRRRVWGCSDLRLFRVRPPFVCHSPSFRRSTSYPPFSIP